MRRRKNPWATFLMFLAVLGFGGASYHYLYVERVFQTAPPPPPPDTRVVQVREAIEGAFADHPCWRGVTNIIWRARESVWRIDVELGDGCREDARRLAGGVVDVVHRASDGQKANVFCYILGAEVAHVIP